MIRSWPSILIGLVVPALALVVGIPLVSDTSIYVAGIPLLFFWVFLWFPLTSICLWISWNVFDRQHYDLDRKDRP